MSSRARAIVLGHGDLAAGLVSAVEQITGLTDVFRAMSNTGLGAPEIEQRLRALVEETGARVVFTDLPAGSCNQAACRLLRDREDVVVVSGVSLPTLLYFATHLDVPVADAAEQSVARGTAALRVVRGATRAH